MQKFLRTLTLVAFVLMPWVTQGQNARVSEYDYSVTTATYSTIVGTSGATAWTATDQTAGYVDIAMPFAMYFGETQIASGSTLRVYDNGSAEFMSLTGSQLAPLYYASGYGTTATSVYTKSTAQQLTVEWRKVTANGNSSYSFQLKLYQGGDIEFCYGPMTLGGTISVFSGLKSSDADVFRARGEGGTLYWNTLERATDYATRTLSSNYYPAQGTVYAFTQPACVKPNTLASTVADGSATLTWSSRSTSFQIRYSTNANFDPATEGTQVTANDTTKTITGLTNFTTYYWTVRAVCGGTPSAWAEKSSFMPGTIVNMGEQATLTTCSAMIFDDGGADGAYSASANDTLVITPATAGKRIRLVGTYYTEGCCDGLTVYDGDSTTGIVLGSFYGEGNIDVAGENGAVTLVFTSDGSVQYDGFAVTATCENIPTCPNPQAPSVTAEGVVTWAASNNATSYDIKWGATGFNPATEGTAVNGLTGLTTTLTGLQSTTTYDVYLRAHCSATSEVTEWIGPVTFTTPCLGSCTHVIDMADSYGDGWENHTLDLYVNGELQEQITLSSGSSGSHTVYLCPGTSFYYVWHWNGGSQYGENSFTITNHDNEVVVSMYESDVADGMIVYSGVSCFTPTCPNPAAPTADAEGNITWNASNNATSYDLIWGATGFDPATEGTLVSNLTGTSYTLTGWESNTVYDVYVRAHCSATSETSEWSGATTFTTTCAPLALPYSEDFTNYSTPSYPYYGPATIPNCWSILSNGTNTELTTGNTAYYGGVAYYSTASSYASMNSYDNYLFMPCYGPSSTYAGARGSEKIAVLPNFTQPISALSIYFDYKMYSTSYGTLQLGYYYNGTFTSLTNITSKTSTTHFEQILGNLTGINDAPAGARIALRWYQTSGSSVGYVGIDNVVVEQTPTCFKPTWNGSPVVTATGATLEWTGNSTYKYEVKVGPTGFDPATEGRSTIVTTNSVTLDYLYVVTNYDAYVRGICSDGDTSAWSNVQSFKTGCQNGGDIVIGNESSTTTSTYIPEYHYYNYSLSEQIFTPAEIAAGTYSSISFYLTQGKSGMTRNVDIYLKETSKSEFTSTSDWESASGAQLVYSGSYSPAEAGWMTIDFNSNFTYSGTDNLMLIFYDKTGSYVGSPYATYKTSPSAASNMSLYKYQDATGIDPMNMTIAGTRLSVHNVIKLGAPCDSGSCNAPSVAIALSETEYAATLTFTDVNGESNPTYGIVYGPQGFDPATAGTTVSPINANDYTITGLQMLTDYDVYVYAICSGVDGRKVRYSFTTPFIPNCKTPILSEAGYGASNITYNTANVSWRQPGDTPLHWVVRYAATDFNPLTAAATDYTEMTVTNSNANLTGLVAGTTYYIYVKSVCVLSPLDESPWSATYSFTTTTCDAPTAVAATDVTNSTAQISWTSNATAWTLKYGVHGFDPDMEGTEVACTTNSIELTGLDAYTTFDVYVKSNCTATDESDWSSVVTFRTACPDGGDVDIVGLTAGTQYTLPANTYFGYSYTQQIITADEIPSAGNIDGVSFSYAYSSPNTAETSVNIYIGTTDKSSFASSSDFVDPASLTLVYSGSMVCQEGWNNFLFNAPFVYDGSSNIVIAVDENASSYSGSAYKFNTMTTSSPMALAYYSDSYNPDPTSSSTLSSFSGSKSTYSYRNVMKLMAACNTSVTCFAPASVSTAITPANVVTVTWAPRTDLRPVVNNYELKYGLEGFDPETQGVLVPALNNVNTYTINADLAANANYDVYVRTACDANSDDYSAWTKGSFTTYPTCWIPVDLTVTATTQTTATLSWANDPLAPTAATRWEVCYGPEGFGDPEYRGTKVETTNNTAFTVDGLNHTRKYEFYVRALCGGTDHSDWSAVATGTTQCGVWQYADMPLVENFDGYTGNTSGTVANHRMPNCWSYINLGTNTSYMGLPSIYNGTTAYYKHSTPNSLRFYSPTATTNGDQIAILPEFGFDLDTLEISFYAAFNNVNAGLQVGVISDPSDASTFEAIETVHATSTNTQLPFEVSFSEYTGSARYVAFKVEHSTSTAQYIYMDDLTVKLREKVNAMPDNGGTVIACNEFVMPDTTNGGSYHGNLNATYVVRPAQAGHVARIQGDYDLENGYDFLRLYRGPVAAANLVGTYTGTGSIDYMTSSNLWVDSGYVTLVLTSDIDNAFPNSGFKFLVTCEQPMASEDTIQDPVETNGTYTWTAGNGQTYTNHSTLEAAPDLTEDIVFPVVNVAGYDSVYRHLTLTVHPTYELNYTATICERDEYSFYGQTYTTAGTYTVPLQSVYGADSVGVLALTVNSAPTAFIQYNNRTVTEVANMCDNFDMTINARSNVEGVTFLWEDSSTVAARVVNPHESNTYSVVAINPATGCTSLPATVTVTTTPVPALTISGDSAICYGQSTTLTLTDANNVPATYRWSNNATTASITVNPTTTTTYTVTATSTTGACVATAEFTVTVNALPVVEVAAAPTVNCQNDMISLTATNVDGYSYMWNTGAATPEATVAAAATGNYTVTVTDQNGCVNEFTTNNVTVNPVYELNDEQSACVGMLPYTWGTQTLTVAGNYDQVFQTINGCDSTVHLTFTVQDTALNNVNRELCEGAAFTFGTGIYEQAYTATASTVITYVDTTSGECPARYNLNLTVNTHNPDTVENTVCDTYTWPLTNETYTTSGAYQTMLQTTKGCDSLVTLNLTVNYQNTGVDMQTACDSYEWIDGNIYTASNNTATYTLANEFGCDSVVTLNLTVNYRSYHEDFHRVCDAKTYTWDDNAVYALDVEVADSIQYITGENSYGCLEIALLHLDLNYVNDTVRKTVEACDEYVIDTVACDNSVATAYLRDNGIYTLRVHNDSLNRDEMLILTLTVTPSTYHTTIATECLPYTWTILDANNDPFEIATITAEMVNGASVYHTSVDMAEAGYSASSCSQIEVLRLTPKYPTEEVTEATICKNGIWYSADSSVNYNGADLNVGLNTMTWNTTTNADGCQHLEKVALTVNPTVADTVNMTYCESEFVNGTLDYIEGNDTLTLTIDAAGLNEVVYTNTLTADWATAEGCTRTVTVDYTVNPTTTKTDSVQALTEFVWDENNERYTGLGLHIDTVETTNDYGCTLYRVLVLELTDSIRHYDTITVCTQYEVGGETYYEDRTFSEADNNNEVWYTTYHVMQRTFNDVSVVSNQPYTWINGETYTANVSNVYYSIPAANPSECDDVYRLSFTLVEPIVICEGQLPYETAYGFTIDTAVSDVYTNATNDTIIAYTVKLNTLTTLNETACDSYTWNDSILGNTTYTESGAYTKTYDAANGCDSIVTLNLTINNSTDSTVDVTVCDTYTWAQNGETYTATGNYLDTIQNAALCDSVVTLNLTVNKNNGVYDTVTACDSYTWNGQTFTTSGDHSVTFDDANGCTGDSLLHLTINNTVVANADSLVNAASTYYLGVLYQAPTDTTINDTLIAGAANGCDSITMMHLQVNMGTIVQVDTVSCGDFTWIDGNTYTWIPMAERTNPVFNYKNRATGVAVEDFPVYEVDNDGDGLIDITYVLHLVMAEASVEYKTVTVLLSNDIYTDPDDATNHVFDFTAEKAAKKNATKLDTLHYGSSYYCDSIVYYTFNLVYNYVDDDTVTVCYTVDSYTTANNAVIALAEGPNAFTDTTAAGTDSAMVHNMVYVRSAAITGTETIAACDSTTWNNTLFTTNVVDSLVTLTAANGCDSIVTLNITITPTIHNVIEPADICDSYYWADKDSTYELSTTDTWSRANTTNAQCTDVDTLKLVVKHSNTGIDTLVACDSLIWIDGITYYASNNTATETLTNAAGCDSVVTLNLTINNSFVGNGTDIDTLGASITLTDKNGSYMFLAPYDGDTTLVYQTVAGCDSTVTFHLTVNQFQIVAENTIECGLYTWDNAGHGTGHTYQWISDAEKSEHTISIPGISPMVPLYKDITADVYVYSNPLDTVGDIVYLLNLNLNEAAFVDSTIARFPVSMGSITLHGTTYDFSGVTADMDTVFSMMIANDNLCGTYMTYHVHLDYNYDTNAVTVCYTDAYTWEDSTTEAVTVGVNVLDHTFNAGDTATEQVVHRTVTVRANNNTYSFDQEACDSYTWNDSVYTATGAYQQTFTDQYECDSVATLNLTVKNNNNHGETIAACDSTQWNGTWYNQSGDYTYEYTHTNGCASVDTLHLTINHNVPQVTTESACDSYTWVVGTWSREYDASGTYTHTSNDANNCPAVDTLQLTVRKSSSYDSVLFVTDGSYRYTSADTTALITAGHSGSFAEHYTNAVGCDSTLNITINVGEGYFAAEDTTTCNSYTWRDGNTYVWISTEERAANGNALYKNQTTGAYVMSNPIYRAANDGDYDSIYMLRLNLTQNYTEDVVINFPISLDSLVYGDSTFHFGVASNDDGREFVNTTVEREVHFNHPYYCDSIHYLTINLQNNYSEVTAENADICVTQTSYTWRNHEISTATNDFDHAHIYYVYDTVGTAEAPVVEYIKVTQHPVVYATERRTACDSYTWNGIEFTNSTSGATFDTVDMWGCDSTVTLMLTIKHNSNLVTTTAECESYQWKANNAAQTLIATYTQSGEYAYEYISDEGCPSTDSLYLTINTNSNTAYTVDECDSYTWNNMTLTASCDTVYAYTNQAGCPSVDTLHLTIRNNSNQGYTQVACDSYEWHDSTYTASTTAYFQYEAANGCASVDTLYLTINTNAGFAETLTACDSINWNGHKYYESGEYTVHYADANGCEADSVLTLTVNNAIHNSETVVACDSYTWTGATNTTYTTSGEYTYSTSTVSGCDSIVTLYLTINHSDYDGVNYATMTVSDHCGEYTWIVNDSVVGVYTESVETSTRFTSPVTACDSIIFLNLTIKNAPVIDTAATVCENTLPYTWRGIEMSAAGVETVTFPLENGCDSTIRFTLTVNPKYETPLTANVCLGSGYTGNGFDIAADELPEVGEYTFVKDTVSEYGCDSIVTLTVNVMNLFATTVEATACDSYTWNRNGATYTASGNYNDTISAVNSCDSVVTLALTIMSSTTGIDEQVACNRYTWIDGNTYTASNNTATFTLENAAGCDSVVTLNLTVNYSNSYEFDDVACDSYTWNGATYSQSGTYTYAGTNVDGCDSVVTLHLTINNGTTATVEATACNSYEWTDGDGQTYTESGAYTYTTTAANSCDSVVTLNLTINNPVNSTVTESACGSYTWNGETYTTSGTYTYTTTAANDCDSVVTLNLTINTSTVGTDVQTACDSFEWIDGIVYTASNNTATYTLTNAAGCDSVVTLNLTINASNTGDTSAVACNYFVWHGQAYVQSGDYTYTTENALGCDSVVTLHLTINNQITTTVDSTVCNSINWNNVDYYTSGSYDAHLTSVDGCDSVVTLNLTVNQPVTSTVSAEACDSYVWNGETYTTSGNYTYTTTAANGCDSVVTLTLTINTPANTTEDVTACESYTWHGQVYTTNGAYTFNFTDVNGCAAVATLNLTINTPANTTETVTACNSYSWNNQTYTNSGVYTNTFVDANGCNATATLNLTINNPVNAYVTATACESYTWNGQTYYTSGSYTYTATAANGCDSVTTLTLTINQPTTATVYAEACGSYTWNGQTYTQPGAYNYTTTGSNGCDSTVTLLLNLVQPVQTIINQTACDSYIWNGTTYTTSGSYSVTETAANGCDSVVTLNLTINNSVSSNFAETACNSYTWNGQAYTTSGTYTQVFTAHNGCDSTVTLNLTINTPTTATVTETACSSFDWNGETYTQSGSYTYTTTGANGCDSVTTLLLTINLPVYTNLEVNAEGSYSWNGETYTESGVYTYTTTAANGCDSIVTLTLTITPVYTVTLVSSNEAWGSVSESGTVAEYGYFTAEATANEGYEFVAWVNGTDTVSTSSTYIFQVTEDITLTAVFAEVQGISTVDMNNVVIYSNDTRIFVNGAEGYDVYVYDVNGRVISRQLKAADAIEFRMSTTGVYLVKVGNAPAKRVIVVR